MKLFLLNFGVFIFCLSSYLAFAQDFPGNAQKGKILYEQNCVRCHGEKGDGQGIDAQFLTVKPKDFHVLESLSKTNGDLFAVIKYGVIFSPMHGWSDRLNDEEIVDIITYIRFLAPFRSLAKTQDSIPLNLSS
jgi:mono/diheme cytochrome c family protein